MLTAARADSPSRARAAPRALRAIACGRRASAARHFVLAIALALLASCAGLGPRPEPPTLSLSGIRSMEMRPEDARMGLRFEATNPNDYEIEVESIDFDVAIEGVKVASGRTPVPFRLPAKGTGTVDVDVAAGFDPMAKATRAALERFAKTIRYEISGTARVAGRSVPFRRAGEVPAPDARSLRLR
jgi:LEA14-like dessication related protein